MNTLQFRMRKHLARSVLTNTSFWVWSGVADVGELSQTSGKWQSRHPHARDEARTRLVDLINSLTIQLSLHIKALVTTIPLATRSSVTMNVQILFLATVHLVTYHVTHAKFGDWKYVFGIFECYCRRRLARMAP